MLSIRFSSYVDASVVSRDENRSQIVADVGKYPTLSIVRLHTLSLSILSIQPQSTKMNEEIAFYAVRYVAKTEPVPPGDDGLKDVRLKKTLERMLDDQVAQNNGFRSLLLQLQLDEDNCCEILCNVFAEMLADGVMNWGRVVTIFCFSGCAVKHMSDRGSSKNANDRISESCAKFVSREASAWIKEQGGWENFSNHFGEQNSETINWTGWHELVRKGIIAVSSAVSVR